MSVTRAAWAARTFAYHAAYNALTCASPRLSSFIQRASRDTGRGRGRDGERAAAYFEAVFRDYQVVADESGATAGQSLFAGKRVLELGPGDTRAFALIASLEGAASWEGFDSFDIQSRDARYVEAIYRPIRARRPNAKPVNVSELAMHVSPESLRAGGRRFDVVVSRAVLEHVRDLHALVSLVSEVVTDDAILVHKVDLRCHGITHDHELDFLRFSERAWHAMSSRIDLPNRERLTSYVDLAERVGWRTRYVATTHLIARDRVEEIRNELAHPFRTMKPEVLSVLGLWLVQVGARHPLAARAMTPLAPAPRARLSAF